MSLSGEELIARRRLFASILRALRACFPDRVREIRRELALLLEPTGMVRRAGSLFGPRKDELRAQVARALRFMDTSTAEERLSGLDQWLAHPGRLWTESEIRRVAHGGASSEQVLDSLGPPDVRTGNAEELEIWTYMNQTIARHDLPPVQVYLRVRRVLEVRVTRPPSLRPQSRSK